MMSVKKTSLIFYAGLTLLLGWFFIPGLLVASDFVSIVLLHQSLEMNLAWVGSLNSKVELSPENNLNFKNLTPYVAAVVIARPFENINQVNNSNKLIFVGDIMLDRGVRKSVESNFAGDFNALFQNLNFSDRDIVFANLEGPASNRGSNQGSIYSFRMLPESLASLARAGFNVLSVANNHSGDWGREAFVDTVTSLDSLGILHPGGGLNKNEATKPQIIQKNGVRFGFLAFSDVGPKWLSASDIEPGILLADDPQFANIISEASREVDILIVSFHFGEEYQTQANDRQKSLAHQAIDGGAKIVIGHHPHVGQQVEEYNEGLIAYSLGNFIFDQSFSQETMQGLLLEVEMDGSAIKSWQTKKVLLNENFRPSIVE